MAKPVLTLTRFKPVLKVVGRTNNPLPLDGLTKYTFDQPFGRPSMPAPLLQKPIFKIILYESNFENELILSYTHFYFEC